VARSGLRLRLGHLSEPLYDRLGTHSNSPIVGQLAPLDNALTIKNKNGGARNVAAFHWVPALMSQAVGVDRHEVGIGEDQEIELLLLCQFMVFLDRIGANGNYLAAVVAYLFQAGLQALQFREAKRSPMATVENQDHLTAEKVGELYLFAVLIEQCKLRCSRLQIGNRRPGGKLIRQKKDVKAKQACDG